MCDECVTIERKILIFRQLLTDPVDRFVAEELTNAIGKLETQRAELHPETDRSVPAPLSDETQLLLDAADRVIERSRAIVAQTRNVHTTCARELHAQELRFAFVRELRKSR